MHRIEIVANRSVKEEIVEGLEESIQGALYTVIPEVEGRGKRDRKLGTTTWPELNFVLFAYVPDDKVAAVKAMIAEVKRRFPNEGVALFSMRNEES